MARRRGWWATEMNQWSDDKKREVLNKYGKEGLTDNTYRWLKARVPKEERREQIPVEKLSFPLQGITIAPAKPVLITFSDAQLYLYNPSEGEGGTYYAGSLGTITKTEKRNKTFSKKERAEAYNEWLNENKNNPEVLFDPKYKNTRRGISDKSWVQLIEQHPEYWNKSTSKMIPTSAQIKLMKRGIRKSTSDAAQELAPLIIGGPFNPLGTAATIIGAKATDEATREISKGKYSNWADLTTSNIENKTLGKIAAFANPGALLFGIGASGALARSNVNPKWSFTERTMVGGSDPKTITKIIQTPGRRGGYVHPTNGIKKVQIIDKYSTEPSFQNYENNYTVEHEIPWHRKGYYRHAVRPGTKTISKTIEGLSAENAANSYLNGPVPFTIGNFESNENVAIPTISKSSTNTWIPQLNFYNTVQDWGSKEFLQWWRQNASGHEGEVLDSPWGKIKIEYGPGRLRNFAGNVAPGLYYQGLQGDKRVLNVEPIKYEGYIPSNMVGVTPIRLTTKPLEYGNYELFKNGGSLNYSNYLK